ncbi:hypothetical protein NDA01_21655 [Trichocoleus desertorum AS-A10]|uniref:hypothetical protein n=1 Tax=Trichocoleus desertorum TaxID=1481672 RepID=UPI00329A5230
MDQLKQSQYLQVVGLLALAEQQRKQLKGVEQAIAELLEVEPDDSGYYGHISDAVWGGDLSVYQLLKRLRIDVEGVSREAQAWAEVESEQP